MASDYPGALDTFSNPTSSTPMNDGTTPHAAQHADANDAIEAIQATLGVDPQGSESTVADRIAALEGGGGGGGGLVLIDSQTGISGASSITFDGVFDSTYDAYRIVFVNAKQSTPSWVGMQLRKAGTDRTSAYLSEMIDKAGGGSPGSLSGSTSEFRLGTWADLGGGGSIDLYGPYLAAYTAITTMLNGQTSGTLWQTSGAGALQDTDTYDGFKIIPGGAYTLTVTGVYVYGYEK